MRRALGLFYLFVFLCYSSTNLLGQVSTASLSGLITDSSGSGMAGVQVRSLNRSTGYSREVATDHYGYYTLPNMPIGSYTVAVQGEGFAKTDESVELSVGSKARRDFTIRIKALQQSITVNENGNSGLSRDDASLSTVIDPVKIRLAELTNPILQTAIAFLIPVQLEISEETRCKGHIPAFSMPRSCVRYRWIERIWSFAGRSSTSPILRSLDNPTATSVVESPGRLPLSRAIRERCSSLYDSPFE
jgi:hypothetical protein